MTILTRVGSIALAGLALASCVAHGQSDKFSLQVHRNYTSHSVAFYERLLAGRVWVFEGNPDRANSVMRALVMGRKGRLFRCFRNWATPKSERMRWSVVWRAHGATVRYENWGPKPRYAPFYYDPETGLANVEIVRADKSGRHVWYRIATGWVQDTFPRVFVRTCPGLADTAGITINEKQTSKKFDELRTQDPDAPIRHFPGSHLTGPGRTGLAASGLAATTTKAEVWSFLNAREGDILLSPRSAGRVFVRGAGRNHEIWGLKGDGTFAWIADLVEYEESGDEWLAWKLDGKTVSRYPMGYPFPYLPTGHRHPAFQLTDQFLARPFPRSLPHMGAAYADKRFVFHSEGKFSVVDRNGDLVEGPHFDGVWRWTRGTLEMTVRDDPAGPRSIGWRELASDLDMQPTVWTRSTPDRIE